MASRFMTRPALAVVGFLWGWAALAAPPSSLSRPSTLSASGVSTSEIQLVWNDPNTTENGYQIERSPNGVTGFVLVGSVAKNATSYVNSGLSPATVYFYRVRATGKQNSVSPYSPVASAATLTPPPAPTPTPTAPPPPPTATPTPAPPPPTATPTAAPPPPTATPTPAPPPPTATPTPAPPPPTATPTPAPPPPTATPTPAPPPPTATPTPAPPPPTATPTPAPPPPTATPTPAPPPPTPTPVPTPSAPSGLSASAASSSQINLSWSDSSSTETGFKVERSTATSGWAQIGATGANATSYASTGLGAATTYSYRVRAYNSTGDSGYSNSASATTSAASGNRFSRRHGDTVDDRGQAVAVDGAGNVVVTGHLDGVTDLGAGLISSFVHPAMGPTVDVVIAEYSSSGAHLWSRVIGSDGAEEGKGIATDSTGNVLVTGYQGSYAVDYGGGPQYNRGGYDVFMAKYSSAGSWVWSRTVGGGGYDQGTGIAADDAGNVVVTGHLGASSMGADFGGGALVSAGNNDVFVVKYSATGVHVWSKRLGSTGNDAGMAIGADSSGNVFVAGTFEGTVDFGAGPVSSAGLRDVFLVKFTPAGQLAWAKRFGGTGDDVANGLAVDSMSNVVVSGKFQSSVGFGGALLTSAGGDDVFVAKLDGPTGNHLWSKRFGSTGGDISTGVAVDGNDNVVVGGYYAGAVDFGGGALQALGIDVFAVKYSSAGAHVWSRRFGGANTQICDGVAAAGNGDVIVTGFFFDTIDFGTGAMTTVGGYDGFLAGVGP